MQNTTAKNIQCQKHMRPAQYFDLAMDGINNAQHTCPVARGKSMDSAHTDRPCICMMPQGHL